ncbi:PqqD family protein [Prosthecobacter sp.]|uniref:PqqD family protein n=1 Tax=Prosthecobacter sp. TaxID=1965333 RepID=UPI001DB71056|nr:PqqD family protein [Prosthecobacter sp.]MCB1278997.1 PqqD family protein [Prosthecobacter sp.]
MKLATHPRLLCQDRLKHDLTLPVPQVVAPAPVETAPSGFDFNTVSWQADGFGFDATTGEFFTASPVALVVMRALSAGLEREQILDRLTAAFEVARSTAERDLETFLAELAHIGLTPTEN